MAKFFQDKSPSYFPETISTGICKVSDKKKPLVGIQFSGLEKGSVTMVYQLLNKTAVRVGFSLIKLGVLNTVNPRAIYRK